MKLFFTLFLIAASACLASAQAQNHLESAPTPHSDCPQADALEQRHLPGQGGATVHPDTNTPLRIPAVLRQQSSSFPVHRP